MSVDVMELLAESVHRQITDSDVLGLALSLESLKKIGANLSYVDNHESTIKAAIKAVENNTHWDTNILEMLLENGACITSGEVSNLFAFPYAYTLPGVMDLANKYCTYRDIKAKSHMDTALIVEAVEDGYTEFIQLYHRLGGEIEEKFDSNQSLLMRACGSSDDTSVKTLELLIKLGADVKAADDEGLSVLFYASDSVEEIEALRKHGLVVAPKETMSDNVELQQILHKCVLRNDRDHYDFLASLAKEDQPTVVIPSFDVAVNPSGYDEKKVQLYATGNLSVDVNVIEQRKAVIRRTKDTLALQESIPSEEWGEIFKDTYQYLDSVSTKIFEDNALFLIEALDLLSEYRWTYLKDRPDDFTNADDFYANADFSLWQTIIFEE